MVKRAECGVWSIWCSKIGQYWKKCWGEKNLLTEISDKEFDSFCYSSLEIFRQGTRDFPTDLFSEQFRMVLVEPSEKHQFSCCDVNSEFELTTQLLHGTDPDFSATKRGEFIQVVAYDEIADILKTSFTSAEVWLIHGGFVVTAEDGGTENDTLLVDPGLLKTVHLARIRILEDETREIELLTESVKGTGVEKHYYTYRAHNQEEGDVVQVERIGGLGGLDLIGYEKRSSPLDRWFFPLTSGKDARSGADFILGNDWRNDPCYGEGVKSIKYPHKIRWPQLFNPVNPAVTKLLDKKKPRRKMKNISPYQTVNKVTIAVGFLGFLLGCTVMALLVWQGLLEIQFPNGVDRLCRSLSVLKESLNCSYERKSSPKWKRIDEYDLGISTFNLSNHICKLTQFERFQDIAGMGPLP